MVSAPGGPADVLADAQLPRAPVQRPVPTLHPGFVGAIDVLCTGQTVLALGGGRSLHGARIDLRVGLAAAVALGARVATDDALAIIHAADAEAAQRVVAAVQAAYALADEAPAWPPLMVDCIAA